MTVGWRILESAQLYAGLGVQLVDEHTNLPIEQPAVVTIEIEDGAAWRKLELEPRVLPNATFFYPRLERFADARMKLQRRYRVQARSDYYWPLTRIVAGDLIVQVFPWDDGTAPFDTLTRPEPLAMIPRPGARFGVIPSFRGRVQTTPPNSTPIADAVVFYDQPLSGGGTRPIRVLSETDGEYALPVRGIATAGLTLKVTKNGVTSPFPFPAWRSAARTTQNLNL